MAGQNDGPHVTFIAGEALEAFRRVKLDTGSGTVVVYAGAGETAIGVTQDKAASGAAVSVRLIGRGLTIKCEAGEALAEGAALYGAASGKVADTAVGTAVATALEAATANGDIIEALFDNGAAAAFGPPALVDEAADDGAVAVIIRKICNFNATPDPITIATAQRDLRIVDWWLRAIDATASNITLKNFGASVSTSVLAKGATVDALVRAASIVEAVADVDAGDDLTVESSAASADIEIYILCIPI